jgi:hypothetical protein
MIYSPCMSWVQNPVLPSQSDFAVAITTVDWPITARFKRYLGFLAALSAYRGKHLAAEAVTAVSETL